MPQGGDSTEDKSGDPPWEVGTPPRGSNIGKSSPLAGWKANDPLLESSSVEPIVIERSLNVLVWSKRRNRILEAIMSRVRVRERCS